MAKENEDGAEKTEEPTPKKIQESRKKGQVARSRELSTALVLIASALSFLLMGSYIAEALFAVMQRTFQLSRDETYDTTHMFQAWGNAFSQVSMPVLFYMLIAMVAGIYGSIALGGYNFTWQSASPKASKISPIAGFKRMFGVEGLVELLKAIGKFFVIAGAAYLALLLFPGKGKAHDKIEDLVRRNVTVHGMLPFYELHHIRLHDHQT